MLNQSEKKIVSAIANTGIAAGEAIWLGVIKAVTKAYGGKDGGEFAREVFKAALPKFKPAIVSRFKQCGLNVTRAGKLDSESVIGGALDYSKQDSAIRKAKATPVIELADSGIRKAERKPKELKGFASERADKALSSLVKRLKEVDPDAASLLNDRMTKATVTARLDPIAACEPSDEEIKMMVSYLTMLRMEPAFDDEVSEEPMLKAA